MKHYKKKSQAKTTPRIFSLFLVILLVVFAFSNYIIPSQTALAEETPGLDNLGQFSEPFAEYIYKYILHEGSTEESWKGVEEGGLSEYILSPEEKDAISNATSLPKYTEHVERPDEEARIEGDYYFETSKEIPSTEDNKGDIIVYTTGHYHGFSLFNDIDDFTGLEYFSGLESFIQSNSNLKELKFKDMNNLHNVLVTKCPNLESVQFEGCPNLKDVRFYLNKNLETVEFDSSSAQNITDLVIRACNVKKLDLSELSSLIFLHVSCNHIKEIDISHNPSLKELECLRNGIEKIKGLDKAYKLEALFYEANDTTLNTYIRDPGSSSVEKDLIKSGMSNDDIDKVTPEFLNKSYVSNNKIENFDFTANTNLRGVLMQSASIKSLNLSKNTDLLRLVCDNNYLQTLDLPSSAEGSREKFGARSLISPQSTTLTAIQKSNGKYEIELPSKSNIANILADGTIVTAQNGVLTLNTIPKTITYDYDTGLKYSDNKPFYMKVEASVEYGGSEAKAENDTESTKSSLDFPPTGDTSPVAILIIVVLVSSISIVYLNFVKRTSLNN